MCPNSNMHMSTMLQCNKYDSLSINNRLDYGLSDQTSANQKVASGIILSMFNFRQFLALLSIFALHLKNQR